MNDIHISLFSRYFEVFWSVLEIVFILMLDCVTFSRLLSKKSKVGKAGKQKKGLIFLSVRRWNGRWSTGWETTHFTGKHLILLVFWKIQYSESVSVHPYYHHNLNLLLRISSSERSLPNVLMHFLHLEYRQPFGRVSWSSKRIVYGISLQNYYHSLPSSAGSC